MLPHINKVLFYKQLLASLPRYESMTTCMCFHPTKNYLLVCYANRKVDFKDLNKFFFEL